MFKDRTEEATSVLRALRPNETPATIAQEVADIKQAILLEEHAQKGWGELLKKDRVRSRYRVALACAVNFMQDFSGSSPVRDNLSGFCCIVMIH